MGKKKKRSCSRISASNHIPTFSFPSYLEHCLSSYSWIIKPTGKDLIFIIHLSNTYHSDSLNAKTEVLDTVKIKAAI